MIYGPQSNDLKGIAEPVHALGQRESGTARLEDAVEAWDKCLVAVTSVWPTEWIEGVGSRRDGVQAEILRRQAG